MIKGFRIGLSYGTTGNYRWAARPPSYGGAQEYLTQYPSGGYFYPPLPLTPMETQQTFTGGPITNVTNWAPLNPNANDERWVWPLFDTVKKIWKWSSFQAQKADTGGNSNYQSQLFAQFPIWAIKTVENILDPCVEPSFSGWLPIASGDPVYNPNAWIVEVSISQVGPEVNNWYNQADTGKFGWFTGLYGDANARSSPTIAQGQLQWINFKSTRLYIPRF